MHRVVLAAVLRGSDGCALVLANSCTVGLTICCT
jgi:hypothetical protein